MLDLRGPDAEGERAESPVRRRVRVAAHEEDAGLGQPLLRSDDVYDPLARIARAEERDALLARGALEPFDHAADLVVGERL
jgi:hypothetical protein